MKVATVAPYTGPVDSDGLVAVYDITVDRTHLYRLMAGVLVSNSKRISMLDVNALLSMGATETMQDAGAIRGQENDSHWLQSMLGHSPSDPRVPFVNDKFHNQLKASGINVVRDGSKLHVMALTNKDVNTLAGDRIIQNGETVRFGPEMKPIAGGLFDPKITGGHGSRAWSAIQLHEPMPSPVMEEPIRRILKLTQKQYEGVITGDHDLPGFGSGPKAIAQALDKINLPREIGVARMAAEQGRKSDRDAAYKRLAYLKSAQKLNLHPRDWVLDKMPVLPAAFRPVSMLGDSGTPLVSDPNYLYKEAIEANDNLRAMTSSVGDKNVGPERLALYHAFKAVTGLGDPITAKSQEKGIKGILKSVFGSSPKFGTMQRKLLSSTVDNVSRAVVVPNPDLDLDSVGLPEKQAYDLYGKFVTRSLVRRGMPMREALRHVKDQTPLSREVLTKEMADRPVFVNRAPVLHKFGILAFKPRLVSGDVLQVPPLIVKGYGMDFDGDAVQIHTPSTDASKKEALERMLPSKNLISPSDFKTAIHAPGQEYVAGLYHMTTGKSDRPPHVFRNKEDMLKAYRRHEIDATDEVHILD